MNKEQFSRILSDPDKAGSESIPLLKGLLDQFPYFQTARMLRLKLLKDENSVHYRKDLKNTSAYAGDRTKLFHFINGGDLKQMQESAKMGLPGQDKGIEQQEIIDDQKVDEDSSIQMPQITNEIVEDKIPEPENIEAEVPIIDQIKVPDPKPIEDFEGITELPYSSETGMTPQEILQKRLDEIKNEKDEPTALPESELIVDEFADQAPVESHDETHAEDIKKEPVPEIEAIDRSESENSFVLEDEIVDAKEEVKLPDVAPIESEEIEEIPETPEPTQEEAVEEVIPYASNYIENGDEVDAAEEEEIEDLPLIQTQENISFVAWLSKLNDQAGDSTTMMITRIEAPELQVTVSVEEDRSQQKDIIDHFIKTNPRIERKKAEFYSAQDMAKRSIADQNELVSETLAKVYADQGLIDRAITAYKQLSLKYPQKKAYFAARIKEINDSGSIK